MTVEPKPRNVILRETVSGLIITAIGVFLIFQPPEAFGVSALYIGAGMIGTGLFFANKKLMTEWMMALGRLLAFWKHGQDG